MPKAILVAFVGMISVINSYSQNTDTLYTANYPQKYRIMPHLSFSTVEVRDQNSGYLPNSPLAIGFGVAIKNTALDFKFGYGVIPLRDKKYGETKSIDLQFHNYNESFMFDLFYQNYRGFYNRVGGDIQLYEDMELLKGGFEVAFILNSRKFSVEAAFEQSEIQLKSAGSMVVGAGAYYYEVDLGELEPDSVESKRLNNVQFGINGGYAYSLVLGKHWLVSAMATVGANFGEDYKSLQKGNIEIYPTVFGRLSTAYHKDDWALSFIMILHNKSMYLETYQNLTFTTTKMEVCFVKNFNQLFWKKKREKK